MTEITSTGFVRTRLDERLAELGSAMRAIFGNDINLDPDSIDGQTIGIFAEAISNSDQLAEDVYQQLDPSMARGVGLSRLVALNGIKRLAGSYTTVTLLFTGTVGAFIPAGSLFKNASTNEQFTTLADAVIPLGGSISVTSRAVLFGPTVAQANTITGKVSQLYGITTVTNPTAGIIGRFEETDEQLRLRRAQSTGTAGQGLTDAIFGYLSNLPGVIQAKVYENPEAFSDANGQVGHSIHAVVLGGDNLDLANGLWAKKSNGVTLVGSTTVTILDSQGIPHDMRFSRPVERPVYVSIDLTTKRGWPADGVTRIKAAIVAWALVNQYIGNDAIQSRVFDPTNSVPGHSVSAIRIGYSPVPTNEDDLPILYAELATFDLANIEVNIL